MQLVRTDQVLCLLGDLTVLGRKELRTDRSVQNVQKDLLKRLVTTGVCVIADQMADQRLRHGTVDRVHGHMVTVVGRPAERQLGEITGSDDDAAGLVRQIHQHLGALSGLGILISNICHFRIMSDVCKMTHDSVFDIDLFQCAAKGLRHGARVSVGPVRGSEGRHRDGIDSPAVQAEQIKCLYCNKQRQRGIQSSRDPDDCRLRADMLQALLQAKSLQKEDLLTAR